MVHSIICCQIANDWMFFQTKLTIAQNESFVHVILIIDLVVTVF